MIVLTFDTETTGLLKRGVKLSDTDNCPHAVQISSLLYDTEKDEILDVQDDIIKMKEGVTIPIESSNVHKITEKISQEKGIPIKDSILRFITNYERADMIIGHNIEFDIKIIKVELERLGYINIFKSHETVHYCTLKLGINITKIETKNKKYKYPKLIELYEKLFNETPLNLHNSLIDVVCCFRCFYKMYFKKDVYEKNSDVKKIIL